ncbi:zinc metallopeptidase [Alkalibacter rhizosphaerae]|uniref:Zinc metallopeptidase n=1 Tax=Alkalibacter rhizosphaerae TaxID=2815577 RepID=A0A974XMR3_9FIRM|nr:zinc metallopeptidase [Alkalibacter rhizosphaerae]QSX08746.1 zinc metallopeptidase [Alkalibacter rhizosphaerae]
MYFPFIFDITMLILVPGLIFAAYAQGKVSSTYNRYLRVPNTRGLTGAQTARHILDRNGMTQVNIELVGGKLTDHYDPRKRVLRLSNEVFNGRSVAAVGIAAHEVGHAIQHQQAYGPLKIRNAIVPVVNLASKAAWVLFFIGFFFQVTGFMDLGILFFSGSVIFNLVTLPVEFNASRRAVVQLADNGLVLSDERVGVKKVLDAAALTYVAALLMSFLQLIRLIALRGSRD